MQVLEPAISLSLKNILLATDFSEGSEVALNHAQAIANRYSAQVHTVHVAAPDCFQLLNPEAFALTFNSWAEGSGNPIGVLRRLMDGLPSEVPLHSGAVWEVVNEIVRRNEIDLLILSSHGRQGIPRLLLGSIAEDVFRNVSCPVLTVGPEVRACTLDNAQVKDVLLATHFEANSKAPLYAKWLSNEFHAQLTVFHVADERLASTPQAGELTAKIRSMVPDDIMAQARLHDRLRLTSRQDSGVCTAVPFQSDCPGSSPS
jgi:nucleotide-binding universal stress UspA family protein